MPKSLSINPKGAYTIMLPILGDLERGTSVWRDLPSFLGSVRRFFRDYLLVMETGANSSERLSMLTSS